jgi:hypothetical protein
VGHTFDFPSWFSIVVVILTVVVSAYTWFHPREPKLSRIVLSTAGRFCARVVLSTPDRLYLNIVTRGSREPKGTVSANSFPSDKIVVVSSPPKTRCGPVMVDKLGG